MQMMKDQTSTTTSIMSGSRIPSHLRFSDQPPDQPLTTSNHSPLSNHNINPTKDPSPSRPQRSPAGKPTASLAPATTLSTSLPPSPAVAHPSTAFCSNPTAGLTTSTSTLSPSSIYKSIPHPVPPVQGVKQKRRKNRRRRNQQRNLLLRQMKRSTPTRHHHSRNHSQPRSLRHPLVTNRQHFVRLHRISRDRREIFSRYLPRISARFPSPPLTVPTPI